MRRTGRGRRRRRGGQERLAMAPPWTCCRIGVQPRNPSPTRVAIVRSNCCVPASDRGLGVESQVDDRDRYPRPGLGQSLPTCRGAGEDSPIDLSSRGPSGTACPSACGPITADLDQVAEIEGAGELVVPFPAPSRSSRSRTSPDQSRQLGPVVRRQLVDAGTRRRWSCSCRRWR